MPCLPRNRGYTRQPPPPTPLLSCRTVSDHAEFDPLIRTPAGEQSVDFANPQAVKALNKALLAHFMPLHTGTFRFRQNRRCPSKYLYPVIWRIRLGETTGAFRRGATIILDVGGRANCIYPLIGVHEYGWRFTAGEVSDAAMSSAQANIQANTGRFRHRSASAKRSGGHFYRYHS